MTISTRLFLLPLGFGLGCLAACYPTKTILNDEHCAVNGGDVYCAEQFPDKPFCQLSACNGDDSPQWGCVAVQPSAECWAECGVEVIVSDGGVELGDLIPCDGTDTESSGSETATTTDSTESTDATETTGPMLCQGPEDCRDPALPFCDMTGACVACDGMPDPDGACAGADVNLPVCFEGACVACADGKTDACVGTTPICNTETNVCEGCSEHDQCPDSACNMAAGNCMDPGVVVHVDGDAANCLAADGSMGNPYCSITTALANSGAEVVIILHGKNGMMEYAEANSIAKPVALFAAMDEIPVVRGQNATLTVSPTGALFMRGVRLGNGLASGMRINGGSAWIERSEIVNNAGGGIIVDGGGMLMLENSFVGGSSSNPAIMQVEGTIDINFSTLALAPAIETPTLECADGSGVEVRNSIVMSTNAATEVACANVTILSSALEMAMGDNVALGNVDINWFTDYLAGDFHLKSNNYPTEIQAAALWESGDPTTDIDGDLRPMADGTPDFAGADRLP